MAITENDQPTRPIIIIRLEESLHFDALFIHSDRFSLPFFRVSLLREASALSRARDAHKSLLPSFINEIET